MNRRQKKKQLKLRNKKLVKEYPFLLPRNVWTDKISDDYNYEYTRYEEIPKGWRKAFGKYLLKELKESLVKHDYLDGFRFSQIKEKWGSLCLYNFGAPEETHNVIHKYEYLSGFICMRCGKPDTPIIDNYGWYEPICKCCYEKQLKKFEEKGRYKIIPYEDQVSELEEDDFMMPLSYSVETYSKGKRETITYDISETVNKIRSKYQNKKKDGVK